MRRLFQKFVNNVPCIYHDKLYGASKFYKMLHHCLCCTLYFSSKNQTYPIYVILLHEVGHVLKLKHLPQPHTIMFRFFNHMNNKLTDIDIENAQRIWGKREKLQTFKSTRSLQNNYGMTVSTFVTLNQHTNLTTMILILSIITLMIILFVLLLLLFCQRKRYSQVPVQEQNLNS